MAARRIKGQHKMKYWGFYVPEELKTDTIKCAEQLNVSDSEYIRIAVESYNSQQSKPITEKITIVPMIEPNDGIIHERIMQAARDTNIKKQTKDMCKSLQKGGK